MSNQWNATPYGLMILALVSLTGCPPPATTKPEAPSAPAQATDKGKQTVGTIAKLYGIGN